LGLEALVVFLVVLAVYVVLGHREPSWDVLERSYVLEHWTNAPATHRYFRAHLLELPLARPFHAPFASGDAPTLGLRSLGSACAALVAAATFALGRWLGHSRTFLLAVVMLQTVAWGMWKLGSGGEEKMLAAAWAMGGLVAYGWLRSRPVYRWTNAVAVGSVFSVAILMHLINGVLVLGAVFAALVAVWVEPRVERRRTWRELALIVAVAVLVSLVGYAVAARLWFPEVESPEVTALDSILRYHRTPAPAPVPRGALAAVLHGWSDAVAPGPVGVVVFVAVLAVGILGGGARARQGTRLRMPWILAAGTLLGWGGHFASFEPWNGESWLYPWVLGTVGLAMFTPQRAQKLGTLPVGIAVALVLLGNGEAYRSGRETRAKAWSEGVQTACGLESMVIVANGLRARALRLFAPQLRVVAIAELFGRAEPYVGRAPISPGEVNAHFKMGGGVCLTRGAMEGLRAVGVAAERIPNESSVELWVMTRPFRSPRTKATE
jgi:hypothetical protein